ncbi:MAG: hypothetical protein WB492_01270 [Christiangramia sp.]
MKTSSHNPVIGHSKMENHSITRTQIYLAVTFIYIYFLTAIFF